MNNVSEFLINDKGYNNSNYINRYNLLKRTLVKINGGNNDLINYNKFIEIKEKKGKNYSSPNDNKEYIISLFKENDIDLIIAHILIFILGFNISEIANIKISNFNQDFSYISIKRNSKLAKRKIQKLLIKIFKVYTNKNSLLSTNYFICPLFKKLKSLTREQFIEERFKTFINTIKIISKNKENNILNIIHTERPRISINISDALILKSLEMFIIGKEYEISELFLNDFQDNKSKNNRKI